MIKLTKRKPTKTGERVLFAFYLYEILRQEYDQLRRDFVVQVNESRIGIYFSNHGTLNTLVSTGGPNGYGNIHTRGVGGIMNEIVNYGALDVTRFFEKQYWYQVMGGNAQIYDYFHVNAPDFEQDLIIGFSNNFSEHADVKWEICLGHNQGKDHSIRDGNKKEPVLVFKHNINRSVFELDGKTLISFKNFFRST